MSPHFRRLSPLKPERLRVGEAQTLVDRYMCPELGAHTSPGLLEGVSHAAFLFSQRDFLLCSFGFNYSEMRAIQRWRWNKGPL